MESLVLDKAFWTHRTVFITGHTGFKGGWLSLWLSRLGANVYGYALTPITTSNFYKEVRLAEHLQRSTLADIRDLPRLEDALHLAKPSVVFHLAAQPLVRDSYATPVETFATNVMGTVNVLEAARRTESVKAIVNITTDKCYQNNEWLWSYREDDRLGGYDPYSASKACSELVTAAYRESFLRGGNIRVATARAGNVIGGGDWSKDRLIPDFLRAIHAGETLRVRSPNAIRPWQHVLEPLAGYLLLAENLVTQSEDFSEAWNFGPEDSDARPVSWIVDRLYQKFPDARWEITGSDEPHEASLLKLDSSKAKSRLQWKPRWNLETALEKTVEWFHAWQTGESMDQISLRQIEAYEAV